MSVALRNPGEYRGRVFEYALIEKKTADGKFNGLSLSIKVSADEVWMEPEGGGDQQWLDCSSWDGHGEGYLVLVKKDGKINESQVQRLLKCAGWDGDFESIAEHRWQPKPIRFDIREDPYQGQINHRINWINDYDSDPGGGGNVDVDRARSLNGQYGAALRALRGNLDRAAKPAPAGKPATPASPTAGSRRPSRPKPTPAAAPVDQQEPAPVNQTDPPEQTDDLPF